MIQFEKVSKSFGADTLLQDLSFKLNRGDKCGLVGRNGCGKSTLLRMITGEEAFDQGVIETPKRYSIGYLSQHITLDKPTVIEQAASHLSDEEIYKAEKILFGLGFKEEDLEKDPMVFSGGFQLRIHLAKVLLQDPDCLLLDEPTNYLDIVSIHWITKFLQGWQKECILISHDRDFMDAVSTHTLGIHRKQIKKFLGGTSKYYTQLLQEEEVYEKTRQKLEKKREHHTKFVTRFGAKASKASQAGSRKKMAARLPVLEALAKLHHLDFTFPYHPSPGKRFMDIESLSFSYDPNKENLISDFMLSVDKGDRIAIVGKNGRGKSTLLCLLAQELRPTQGKIKVSANLKIGFFGQSNIERLNPKSTIEEEILSASPHLSYSQVRKICGTMMFSGELAKKPIHILSGGEKSRVLLGKILASPCNLLLLDEPTNHLDMESIEALISAMEQFEGAIVLVTHSELIVRNFASKLIVCHQGTQHLFTGNYAQFLEQEGWGEQTNKKTRPIKKKVHEEQRVLKKKSSFLENRILRLEEELAKEDQQILIALDKSQFDKVAHLSAAIEVKKNQIDTLFDELESVMNSLDNYKK